ncbi:MAG: transcriptional regulator [Firmicutes bacterium]|nr:transcriptional regulator [Bacillota bacterium]
MNEERGFGVDPSASMTEYVPQSISEQHPPHPLLSMLLPVLPALAKALGPDAEVVLHDLTEPNNGIIGIEGNVTGRKVGGPTTDLVLKMIKQGNANHMLNYRARTSDGRILRSSTIFLKDESGALVGALCINIDISFWLKTHSLVSGLVATTDLEEKKSQESSDCQETFARDIEELMRVMVDEAVQSVGIPMPLAQKDDKMRVVKRLDENGVFLVKGAVDYVAHILGISRYTVYNYLDETRVAKYTEGAL